ncbi:tryptophan synthase subunit alpha [Aequorivita antarctica]|uniref:Tryptophan synthase alpha chain n=1 Tax=Aequorivita antarctica TaxID=153266 RepID=A0A5C6YXH2_9FLAO|nr:tryptophan synthase subunit alpha [Aequorivita antarctica]TXD72295.1 tryptophan synthase subunit alpha [Aequorivita antarctica]SRX74431.1 Tryptophan synthase alpha chain [Aequorivita antarctica]
MNRIKNTLSENKKLLSIYFTAGYPKLDDTIEILQQLEKSGVDLIEIGLPFSDPLADGPTIQASSQESLENGMTTDLLFQQLKDVRNTVSIPLIIMGYFNPVLQFGVENFCKKCAEVGIDGLILPDLPLAEYEEHYAKIFKKYGLLNIFLITPQTSKERIRQIDTASKGFIYMVSSASVTGSSDGFGKEQENYFERIASLKLNNPLIVGFGIQDSKTFSQATLHTNGAIIGSAFIKMLSEKGFAGISSFIKSIR